MPIGVVAIASCVVAYSLVGELKVFSTPASLPPLRPDPRVPRAFSACFVSGRARRFLGDQGEDGKQVLVGSAMHGLALLE